MFELLRNLAAFGREILDAAVVHTCGPAIDTATASPLHGHAVELELNLRPASTLIGSTR